MVTIPRQNLGVPIETKLDSIFLCVKITLHLRVASTRLCLSSVKDKEETPTTVLSSANHVRRQSKQFTFLVSFNS